MTQLEVIARSRLIAVGVRDEEGDRSTLAWAMEEAVPGVDTLYLVHAYVPLVAGGRSWEPVAHVRDKERLVVAHSLQRLRIANAGLKADGSAVDGSAADMLTEFSEVVDLVVLGEDDDARTARPPTAWQVQRAARCPVVVVPSDYRREDVDSRAPVTVVVDALELPQAALEFGFSQAARRGTSLCVAQFWTALHEERPWTAELIASRQEQLDAQLADWLARKPSVGIIGELRLDDGEDSLTRLRTASQLVVAAAGSAYLRIMVGPSSPGCCPTVIVAKLRAPGD